MFNRQIKVSVEKPSKTQTSVDPRIKRADLEANIMLVKNHARELAVGGVMVFGACKAISTAATIAINIAPKR